MLVVLVRGLSCYTLRSTFTDCLSYIADKEHWEPIIRALLLPNGAASDVKLPGIRELWSLDALDHGDSAVANHVI